MTAEQVAILTSHRRDIRIALDDARDDLDFTNIRRLAPLLDALDELLAVGISLTDPNVKFPTRQLSLV